MSSTRTRARARLALLGLEFRSVAGFLRPQRAHERVEPASGACAKGFAILPGAEISCTSEDSPSPSEDSARSETRAASLGRGISRRRRARRECEQHHLGPCARSGEAERAPLTARITAFSRETRTCRATFFFAGLLLILRNEYIDDSAENRASAVPRPSDLVARSGSLGRFGMGGDGARAPRRSRPRGSRASRGGSRSRSRRCNARRAPRSRWRRHAGRRGRGPGRRDRAFTRDGSPVGGDAGRARSCRAGRGGRERRAGSGLERAAFIKRGCVSGDGVRRERLLVSLRRRGASPDQRVAQ